MKKENYMHEGYQQCFIDGKRTECNAFIMLIQSYLKEIKLLKPYLLIIITAVSITYSLFFLCADELTIVLFREDGFFEWMTAALFLVSSGIFFLTFLRTKNVFLLGLAFIFIVGAGEEISWGQRLFNLNTPDWIQNVNVQQEINIHNLEIFNDRNLEGVKKTGLQRLVEINMLFRIFSMFFCILLPLFFFHIKPKFAVNKKFQIPVAPVTIGIFFFISWAIFYLLKYAILPRGKIIEYYLTIGEVFEFTAALVYLLIAIYFFREKDDNFLGKDIKQWMIDDKL